MLPERCMFGQWPVRRVSTRFHRRGQRRAVEGLGGPSSNFRMMTTDTHELGPNDTASAQGSHDWTALTAGPWFGAASLLLALAALASSIVSLSADTVFGFDLAHGTDTATRVVMAGQQIQLAAPVLALASLLTDDARGRLLARIGVLIWVLSLLVVAVATQRGLS